MNKVQFLEELEENLELESKVTFETKLKDLEEWDSLTAMVLIGFFSDNFEVNLSAQDIENLTSLEKLLKDKNIELTA